VILLMEEKQQTHQNAIEVLNVEQQHYQIQQKLEEYATSLKDGEPCPLCGSLSHPQKFNTLNIRESLANIKREIGNHEKMLVAIDKSLNRLTEINTALCLKEESLRKIEAKQDEHLNQLNAHRDLFEWDDLTDEKQLTEMFQQAEKLRNDISSLEKEIETLRIQIEKENNQKEMYSKALVELKNNSIQESAAANTLKEQLVIYQPESFFGMAPAAIEQEKDKLLKQYKLTEEQYQRLFDKLTLFRKDQDTLMGKLDSCRQSLVKEDELLRSVSLQLEEQLQKSAYSKPEYVRNILAVNIDPGQERRKVNTFRQEMDFAVKQLRILSDEMEDQQFDAEIYQKTQESVQKLSLELNRKNQEKGQAELSLQKLKADFEKRESLLQVFTKLENRLEDIKTLKQLFKGNGFVKYISSVYLQELVNSANDRFYKLSGQKLSLELNDENDFEVRDYLNGGKLRNVKTLSGGQTFQAALSLALALSDNTRRLSGADENFFFLDEGFGSLDKDSLRIVFETLKSLRHENRVVGIISHVEEMNQEIDIHLTIQNKEELGSFIGKSWE
jgi:exonuclease SbcC